jgi:two-component system invasion response regulator UvrY
MEKIRIMIVDDHKLIRESLTTILSDQPFYEVVAICSTAEEGLRLAEIEKPDILITDINMPGMTGIDSIPVWKKVSPATKIIGMSLYTQPSYAKKMFQSGAHGYVTKNSPLEELFMAIKDVQSGKRYICNEIKNKLSEQLLQDETTDKEISLLSNREIMIIELIRQGFSSKELAKELCISPKTVEVHRYNILKKLNLSNTAALVNFANTNQISC